MELNSANKYLEFKIGDKVILDLITNYFDNACLNKKEDRCFVDFHCIDISKIKNRNLVLDTIIGIVYQAAEKEGLTKEPSFVVSFYL